jgi:polar amino acid transport system substrate-binding protein
MRRIAVSVLVVPLTLAAAGCGGSSHKSTQSNAVTGAASASSCAKSSLRLVNAGMLTAGTDNPAYPPWFSGTPHSPWKVSDPRSGKGYESAVAFAVAKQLGFSKSQVKWVVVPFNTAFAPGKKKFDFDINQISFKPARAKAVDFSKSYYDVNQAIVVKKGTPIANVHTVAALKNYKLGAQLGTTSYDTIVNEVKPSKQPAVFDTNDAAVTSLKNGQIDGLVVDLPTAFYVISAQVPNSKVLGRFPAQAGGEHFGMVFAKGNPLVACVNGALTKLQGNGTLHHLQEQWLSNYGGAPLLK